MATITLTSSHYRIPSWNPLYKFVKWWYCFDTTTKERWLEVRGDVQKKLAMLIYKRVKINCYLLGVLSHNQKV